jgi:hypothetical protein
VIWLEIRCDACGKVGATALGIAFGDMEKAKSVTPEKMRAVLAVPASGWISNSATNADWCPECQPW